ncbi:helix-turn-helix domain-containing protein [Ellagibacter isourolithinifaciens]|uniref:helix-turn-helix domain-containing protein n=1 Tax=Ellagibacter isourolithinifaciens TaxID=2137581 RepID=UPI0023F2153F|nr:helix-turn-helix domain-containing protein [Ellagibacter isourolithinifaciens]MDD5925527.1 helix-turn-helix domain-containing protein [Ellagibacter isourolithinifaciens]
MNTREDVLTVREASKLLKLSESKVYGLLREGSLKGVHIGRSWRTSVKACDEFLEEQSNFLRLSIRG